jgi:hypothetical protein
MNNVLKVTDTVAYFATPRVGSTAITGAILAKYDPDAKAMADNAAAPEGRRGMPQSTAKREKDVTDKTVLMPVRDPVDRFKSAFAIRHLLPLALREIETVDAMLDLLEGQDPSEVNPHFRSQHLFVSDEPNELRFYKFPDHLTELGEALGLDAPIEPDHVSESEAKPTLTSEQETRVQALYADDITFFESITEAGQVFTPPEPEPTPIDPRQAAFDIASVAFKSLPLGKQVFWEPVRAAVGEAILAGETASVVEILTTVPTLYDGMEDDRATFLALFAN